MTDYREIQKASLFDEKCHIISHSIITFKLIKDSNVHVIDRWIPSLRQQIKYRILREIANIGKKNHWTLYNNIATANTLWCTMGAA